MPCTPEHCDEHDFMVAPGSAWCRMEFAKRGRNNKGGRVAAEMDLVEAIDRMGDLVEQLLEERKERFRPRRRAEPPQEIKKTKSNEGYKWNQQ